MTKTSSRRQRAFWKKFFDPKGNTAVSVKAAFLNMSLKEQGVVANALKMDHPFNK